MVRTTPPRPLDITALFPELREHSRTATRLHPRPGAPTVMDSSVGGPLLWPADEVWPVCDDAGAHEPYNLTTPAALHRRREILAAAEARGRLPGGDFLTVEERAELDAADALNLDDLIEDPSLWSRSRSCTDTTSRTTPVRTAPTCSRCCGAR